MNAAGSEDIIKATAAGSVEVYYNDSKKWETTNEGTVTTGIATATAIDAAISAWVLGANGTSHYTFTGPGNLSASDDPTLELQRGQTYVFRNRSGGHPFRIQSTINGSSGTQYNTGVTNNDGGDGTDIIFDVPMDAPPILYYQCTSHANMGGRIRIGETRIPLQDESSTANYGLLGTDAGQVVHCHSSTTAVTVNIDTFDTGDIVTILNGSGSNITITQGTSFTLRNSADGTTGSKTLGSFGMANIWFSEHNFGYISGAGLS